MARTKAQRLKAKRGRPALPAQKYEANGRLSRRQESTKERDMEALSENPNIQRRIREDNIVPFKRKDGKTVTALEQATDPMRGYVLGRLHLDGTITKRQHEAGILLAGDMARYYGLSGVTFPSARAQNLFAIKSYDGEEGEARIDAAKKAKYRAGRVRDICLAVGDINTGRKVLHTVLHVAVMDIEEARGWPPHMINWLRKGLNALADYYQIDA